MDVDAAAAEVRGIERGRDYWRRALLVACFVERARGRRTDLLPADAGGSRVSPEEFARRVGRPGFSADTVARVLDRWNEAADAGLVNPASGMTGDDADTYEPNEEQAAFFRPRKAPRRDPSPKQEEWDWFTTAEKIKALAQDLQLVTNSLVARGDEVPGCDFRNTIDILEGLHHDSPASRSVERVQGEGAGADVLQFPVGDAGRAHRHG